MKHLAMIAIGVAVLVTLMTWVISSPGQQAPLAELASIDQDDILLEVDVLSWGVPRKELRSILRERGYGARRQVAATLGFLNDDLIFSLAYEVTNKSNRVLTVFGRDTIGLDTLPIVTGDPNGAVRLLLTTDLDPNVDFPGQLYIGGRLLAPGETHRAILSIPYPLQDQWARHTVHEPATITFCVGLTTDTDGTTAASLGKTGPDLYWPMGNTPSPIEACKTLKH